MKYDLIRTSITSIFFILITLSLSGCVLAYPGATYSDPYGFFSGLLHGLVFPFALIAYIISWVLSIFGINIYIPFIGSPNTGFLFYYVGYFFGLAIVWLWSLTVE